MIWCLKWRNGIPTWPLKWVHQHLNMVLVITQLVTFKRLAMILANISQAHPFEGDRGRGLCFIMSITHVSMYSSQCIRWQPISGFSVYKKGWLVPRSNWYYLEHVFSHICIDFPREDPLPIHMAQICYVLPPYWCHIIMFSSLELVFFYFYKKKEKQ